MLNNFKLLTLFAALTALLMFTGYSIGGSGGLFMSLIMSIFMQGIAYWNSDKIALAMNRAEEITENDNPKLFQMTKDLAEKAALPMPKLYITRDPSPNAFATGRDPEHSAVAVTEGLLRILNDDEVRGVIAHELGHIKNRDVFISTVAAIIAGTISSLVQFAFLFSSHHQHDEEGENSGLLGFIPVLLTSLVAPILAMIIQMMISRSREYEADATAAEITKRPDALASALLKISDTVHQQPQPELLKPAYSSLYIANPFSGDALKEIFSTHPPIEKRVDRLLRN